MRGLAVLIIALGAAPAFAQEAPLDKVYACAGVADSAQRLACFDAAVSALKQAQSTGGVAVVSRGQIEAAEREAFGLDAPSLSELARSASKPIAPSAPVAAPAVPGATTVPAAAPPPPMPQPLDNVTLTIKLAEKRPNGTYKFTMDNGQVWVQTDTYALGPLPKGPMPAEVRKAALGTFMLKPGGRAAVRVERVK